MMSLGLLVWTAETVAYILNTLFSSSITRAYYRPYIRKLRPPPTNEKYQAVFHKTIAAQYFSKAALLSGDLGSA